MRGKVEHAGCELRTQMGVPCSKSCMHAEQVGEWQWKVAHRSVSLLSIPNCVGIVPVRLLEFRYLRGVERRQG